MRTLRFVFTWRRWRPLMVLFLAVLTLLVCDRQVRKASSPYLFDHVNDVPHCRVGLVLGARAGSNPFFTRRIAAASALYHAGRVDHLIVSGDNGRSDYNEPMDMRAALIAAGVDSSDITLDFAGFRTLDSVLRALKVFGQQRFVVVSQRFHNERAVFLARQHGIEAVGFNAEDVGDRRGLGTLVREKFARTKVFLDLLLDKEPHFLGDPVPLGGQELP